MAPLNVRLSLGVTRAAMLEVGVSAGMTSPLYSLTLSLSLPFRGEHRISKFHAFAFFPFIIKHCRPRKYTRADLDINTWLADSISKREPLSQKCCRRHRALKNNQAMKSPAVKLLKTGLVCIPCTQ